jgi:5-methylcytosine-specific restriction endonuclease McrA
MSEQHIPAALRRLVADRGKHCCEYRRTQGRYSSDSFTVDHITPRSLGGPTKDAFDSGGGELFKAFLLRT